MKLNKSRFKASLKILFIVSFFLIAGRNFSYAQEATVYVSPYDLGKTLSNIYFSIDKNGFKYVNTLKERSNPSGGDQFDGRVQIITFETQDLSKIIACEPTAALELPLKIIVWEEEGDIYLAYINPTFYKRRHSINGCDEVIQELTRELVRVVNDAIRTQ